MSEKKPSVKENPSNPTPPKIDKKPVLIMDEMPKELRNPPKK